MSVYEIRQIFLLIVLCILGISVVATLVRVILGPRVSDRIVAVNMISTQTIVMVAVLSVYLDEAGLADVSMLYAMLSFLAVVVLTKVYIGVYQNRQTNLLRRLLSKESKKGEQQ